VTEYWEQTSLMIGLQIRSWKSEVAPSFQEWEAELAVTGIGSPYASSKINFMTLYGLLLFLHLIARQI